jgi:hypothetical protein
VVIQDSKFLVMTREQWRTAKFDDDKVYGWGHCGPNYINGKIVLVVETIGL